MTGPGPAKTFGPFHVVAHCTFCGTSDLYVFPSHPAPARAFLDIRALAERLVEELDDLIGESGGVYGLHLNGDDAPWDSIITGGRFERLNALSDLKAYLLRDGT